MAAKLYKNACDAGYASSCTNLGILYGTGKGVKTDYATAKELFKKACKMGSQSGCNKLSILKKMAFRLITSVNKKDKR